MTDKNVYTSHLNYCTEIRTEMNKGLASFFLKLPCPMSYEVWSELHRIVEEKIE